MSSILEILGKSTPVSEVVANELGLVRAAIVCRVFFQQQLRDRVCKISNQTFCEVLGLSAGAISSNLKWLLDNGYIQNIKPMVKGRRQNEYRVTSKFYDLLERNVREMNVNVREMNVNVREMNVNVREMKEKEESLKESLKESKEGAGAKNAPRPPGPVSSEDQSRISKNHPAIEAFRRAMHRYPPKNEWRDIAAEVGHIPGDVEFWEQVVRAWKLGPWSPQNTSGMLDHYKRREIPSTRRGPAPQNGSNSGLSSYERRRKLL